eukprot:TRINITY_DN6_c0_g2_i5.p1 TRINITY_DN6_c0_g2~~TRINITY_DN6_c0_g2_i5.p1  ORF type:complete len:294 (-),score=16.31 TRINITY_DN6_c0_g2_i5:558-1439(-)
MTKDRKCVSDDKKGSKTSSALVGNVVSGSDATHPIDLISEEETKEDSAAVGFISATNRALPTPCKLLAISGSEISEDEEQSTSTEYSMLIFRIKSNNLKPNYPPIIGEHNLLYSFVKGRTDLQQGGAEYVMSCKQMSGREVINSLPEGYTNWPILSICTKAFEYCDRLSQWEEDWAKKIWNILGKPKSEKLVKLLVEGPISGDKDELGRDKGFEAYVFLFFYVATKIAMKKKISLDWFEWKTIEHFIRALNDFGWRVGDLNYDNTENTKNNSSPWRFPTQKYICGILQKDLAP